MSEEMEGVKLDIVTRKQAKLLNRATYYTGQPCKRGHYALRGTANGCCTACVALKKADYDKAYRERHIDAIREYDKRRPRRRKNPEKLKASKNRHYKKHKQAILEKQKLYNLKNKEAKSIYFRVYKKENAGKVRYWNARREIAVKNRAPKWLTADDLWLIKEIYDLAALRTKMHGFSWHVDHIIPLQGKLVSGLHIPENMQVIPGIDNIKKNNKWMVGDNYG